MTMKNTDGAFMEGDCNGMFKMKLKNKYHLKLTLSILALSIAIVTILTLLFSSLYSGSLMDKVTADNRAAISKENVAFENLVKEMDHLQLTLQTDMYVYSFLNENENDDSTRAKALIFANKIYSINTYVDSIALYNKKINDYVLLGNDGFDPSSVVAKIASGSCKTAASRIIVPNEETVATESSPHRTKKLLSLVYEECLSDGTLNSMIIINLDWNAVKDGILGKYNGSTLILDSEGNCLSFQDKTDSVGVTPKECFQLIQKNGGTVNAFRSTLSNRSFFVTYVQNTDNNWSIFNIQPYNDILSSLSAQKLTFLLIASLVMAGGLLAGCLLSKRLYSPIRQIASMVKATKYADVKKDQEELSMISNAYQNALAEVSTLEQASISSKLYIKQDCLRNLLMGNQSLLGSKSDTLEDLTAPQDRIILPVVFKIDCKRDLLESDQIAHEKAIMEVALKILEKDYTCDCIPMYHGTYSLLIPICQEQNTCEELISLFENILLMVKDLPDSHLTIGIGCPISRAEELKTAYEKALELTKYRFVLGYGRVITQQFIADNLTNSLNYPEEIEKNLICAINTNSKEEFDRHLSSLIGVLKNYIYPDALFIFLQTALECIRTMNRVTLGYKPIKLDFEAFSQTFETLQTLDEAKLWLAGIFERYQEQVNALESIKSNKSYDIIQKIQRYVDGNLGDVSLSVELLSEKAGYTPNYFSKIFKNASGQNISEYIRQKRIAKAKEMLKNTNDSVNEISKKVGFINPTYFYTVFKKEVGLTPNAYRNYNG